MVASQVASHQAPFPNASQAVAQVVPQVVAAASRPIAATVQEVAMAIPDSVEADHQVGVEVTLHLGAAATLVDLELVVQTIAVAVASHQVAVVAQVAAVMAYHQGSLVRVAHSVRTSWESLAEHLVEGSLAVAAQVAVREAAAVQVVLQEVAAG